MAVGLSEAVGGKRSVVSARGQSTVALVAVFTVT